MKLIWGQKTKSEGQEKYQDQDILCRSNIIKLRKTEEYLKSPEKRPTREVLQMCNSIRLGKLNEYWGKLEKIPKEKIIGKFLGIIGSQSSRLPIVFDEEMPTVVIAGISFDQIQNVQARMITKITLLLLVESESQKLGIWNQLRLQWTEKYIQEIKAYVQIIEAMIKQCENSKQEDKVEDLRNSIKLIKETNQHYAIDW